MAELKFEVLAPNAEVFLDGDRFSANDNPHEPKRPSKALVKAAGSAHAAGIIKVTKGVETSHVETQAQSEKALTKAMGKFIPPTTAEDGTSVPGRWDGPWGEANRAQAEDDRKGAAAVGIEIDVAPAGGEDE